MNGWVTQAAASTTVLWTKLIMKIRRRLGERIAGLPNYNDLTWGR